MKTLLVQINQVLRA